MIELFDRISSAPFDHGTLSPPDVETFPKRGNARLLACGATAWVILDKSDLSQLSDASDVTEFESISHDIIRAKSVFLVKRSSMAHDLAVRLYNADVPVEILTKEFNGITVALEDDEYFSKRIGDNDIQEALGEADTTQRLEIVKSFGNTLGKIHLAGVAYGNNHLGNMILGSDNTVHFIDFKTAKAVEIEWNRVTAEEINKIFAIDLSLLVVGNLRQIGCSNFEIDAAIQSVVDNYPVSDEVKTSFLKLILK